MERIIASALHPRRRCVLVFRCETNEGNVCAHISAHVTLGSAPSSAPIPAVSTGARCPFSRATTPHREAVKRANLRERARKNPRPRSPRLRNARSGGKVDFTPPPPFSYHSLPHLRPPPRGFARHFIVIYERLGSLSSRIYLRRAADESRRASANAT